MILNIPAELPKSSSRIITSNGGAPAESPDLNQTEKVWSHLKQYLTHFTNPRNKQEMVSGIKEYWSKK